ncbi:MAG: sigma-E processing peptidase SpoIIGA [Oscillospiraceae bacterium]|nr:sigma-E processing peptidase SpoIIGA [Oscillospiraceae bacterium]
MVVYGDIVVSVNTALNFLIFLLGGRLCGYPTRPWRCFVAGGFGGIYALVCYILPSWVSSPLGQALSFSLISPIAYGFRRRAIRPCAMAFLCSTALAGCVFLLTQIFSLGAILFHGGLYYPIGTKVLLLTAAGFYLVATIFAASALRHGKGELQSFSVSLGEKTLHLNALVDTGNTLQDPMSGLPVAVLDGRRCGELLSLPVPHTALQDPTGAFSVLQEKLPHIRLRLVPYRAVGVDGGLLLAAPCTVQTGKTKPRKALVAFSPTPVSDGGEYEALIGGDLC